MQSEVIYKESSSWMGRYAEDEGYEIMVFSDFKQPWPYIVEKKEWEDENVNTKTAKLSMQAFNKLKQVISSHPELTGYPDEMEPKGWASHSAGCEYFFGCGTFTKAISGTSLFNWCYNDYDNKEDTPYSKLYKIEQEIKSVLKDSGVDFV